MIYDTFEIHYSPVNPGTDKTEIFFYGNPKEAFSSHLQGLQNQKCIYVTDTTVAALPFVASFLESVKNKEQEIVILESGEQYKTIDSVLHIVKTALESGLQRNSVFVGIGGGVICDMTAFASSIFKRGAKLELIPTTLLSMVDAAIGGKTGCDFQEYKNMLGTFYPASKLHIVDEFVYSLSETEFLSGLAEVYKTGLLYAPKIFQIMDEQKEGILNKEESLILQLIKRCAIAKANIVEKDLTETGLRMQLNLGHTFAHALETLTGLGTVSHGDAVAWGIGRAIALSRHLGLCQQDYVDDVFRVLNNYQWSTEPLHPAFTKVMEQQQIDKDLLVDMIIKTMKKDKKNSTNTIRCILQREINSTLIEEVADTDIIAVLNSNGWNYKED